MVLAENSGYCGSKYSRWTSGNRLLGAFQLTVDKRRVEDQLRRVVGDLSLPPRFNLALQRLEISLNRSTPTESVSTRLKLLVCLASTGVKTPIGQCCRAQLMKE